MICQENVEFYSLKHDRILVLLFLGGNKLNDIKMKFVLPDYKDLLRYGEIVSDHEYNSGKESKRVRKIRYMGILYHLCMINGEVSCLKQWDCFPYDENENDIKKMTDDELANMLMFSDRDRTNNDKAEEVYRLCVEEINYRQQ